MRKNFSNTFSLSAVIALLFVSLMIEGTYSEETGSDSLAEIQAREEIMSSQRWIKAKLQFDDWLSVQTAYTDDQVEALKSELRNRIAVMSAQELEIFLPEMESKLAILMSPASMDARRWASKYTDKALKKITKQYGVEDPMRMPALDIESALRQFAADRQSKMSASSAFNSARESQAKAAKSYHQKQAQAAARAARMSSSASHQSSSAYAPKSSKSRVRTYSAAYPKLNYSIGPWGGVWVNPRR